MGSRIRKGCNRWGNAQDGIIFAYSVCSAWRVCGYAYMVRACRGIGVESSRAVSGCAISEIPDDAVHSCRCAGIGCANGNDAGIGKLHIQWLQRSYN